MNLSPAAVDRLVLASAAEILGTADLSLGDNFFALGGTSMAAIDLILLLSDRLARDVALDIIFEQATFGLMAREISRLIPKCADRNQGGECP